MLRSELSGCKVISLLEENVGYISELDHTEFFAKRPSIKGWERPGVLKKIWNDTLSKMINEAFDFAKEIMYKKALEDIKDQLLDVLSYALDSQRFSGIPPNAELVLKHAFCECQDPDHNDEMCDWCWGLADRKIHN